MRTKSTRATAVIVDVNGVPNIEYTPALDFEGEDEICYLLIDSLGLVSDTAKVCFIYNDSISTQIDTTLTANNDTATTAHDTPVTIDILANDVVSPGQSSWKWNCNHYNKSKNGTVTVQADNTIVYDPNAGFSGCDSLQYEYCATIVASQTVLCDTAWVEICVDPICDIIVPNGVSPNGDENNDFLIIQGVDCDPEGSYELLIFNR